MSWDVKILALGEERAVDPLDEESLPMGSGQHVREIISRSLPVEWAWSDVTDDGRLLSQDWRMDFKVPTKGIVKGFDIQVRGSGDPLPTICSLCAQNGWSAVDTTTGEFLDIEDPSREGWERFQRFRGEVAEKFSEL